MCDIPCEISPTATFNDVFGHLGTIGDQTSIRLYVYDPRIPAARRPQIEILDGGLTFNSLPNDPNTGAPLDPNFYGFWVITAQEQYFAVPKGRQRASPCHPCRPITGQVDDVKTNHSFLVPLPVDPLTGDADGGGNDIARVMVANPFPRPFKWKELIFADISGVRAVASFGPQIDPVGYIYDPTSTSGQPYITVGDPGETPGVTDEVKPYQGFWVIVKEGADLTPTSGGQLDVPQMQ